MFRRRRQGEISGAVAVCVGVPSSAATMGILEKISEIEKEIARTQKNKGEGRLRGACLPFCPPQFFCLLSEGMLSSSRAGAGSKAAE